MAPTSAKEALANVKKIKNNNLGTVMSDVTQGTAVCAGIGALIGLGFGFYNKKPLFWSAFAGMAGGAAISYFFISKNQ